MSSAAPVLKIELLGPLRLTFAGQDITAAVAGKARAVLCYLAVEAPRAVPREELACLIWPDQPTDNALHNLRQLLTGLRKALSSPTVNADLEGLVAEQDRVRINPLIRVELDWHDFKGLVEQGLGTSDLSMGARPRPNPRALKRAVSLYRGGFLESQKMDSSMPFEEWRIIRREEAVQLAISALSFLSTYHEKRGELWLARKAASRLAQLAPWDEEPRRRVMRLLAAEGQWSAALAEYHSLQRYLQVELDLRPVEESSALYEDLRRRAVSNDRPALAAALHNLPSSSTVFVGRARELEELPRLLCDPRCRLVSLLGAGGSGKTRLAMEAARELVGVFPDGVWALSLAGLENEDQAMLGLAAVLGLRLRSGSSPREQLIEYLRGRQVLLVLDNYEHFLPQTGWLEALLQAGPDVCLLVTTRQRLGLVEERIFPVSGLEYPFSVSGDPDWLEYSAMALFAERCRQRNPAAVFDDVDRQAVWEICKLVDGFPLGIEMAAAAAANQGAQPVAAGIKANLARLVSDHVNIPERQRGLEASFEYSWNLLTPTLQDQLVRLALFRGGFDAAAAEQISGVDAASLALLVDSSFLSFSDGRWNIHTLHHCFLGARLSAREGYQAQIAEKHARYYGEKLAQLRYEIGSPRHLAAIQWIQLEIENIRAAWLTLVNQGMGAELSQCLDALARFYDSSAWFGEALDVFSHAARVLSGLDVACVRAAVLNRQALFAYRIGDMPGMEQALIESRQLLENCGCKEELATCYGLYAYYWLRKGEVSQAQEMNLASQALFDELDHSLGRADARCRQADLVYRAGRVEEARAITEEALKLAEKSGDRRAMITVLNQLGDIQAHLGQDAESLSVFRQSLELSRELGDLFKAAIQLNNIGTVLYTSGDIPGAEAAYRESLAICEQIGDPPGQAMALSNLAEALVAQERFDEGQGVARRGLAISEAADSRWEQLSCYCSLAEALAAADSHAEAHQTCLQGLALAGGLGSAASAARLFVTLAQIEAAAGRVDRAAEYCAALLDDPAVEQYYENLAVSLLDRWGVQVPADGKKSIPVIMNTMGIAFCEAR